MKRLVLTAALIAIGGLATAASAGEATQARSHSIQGRTLVWHAPKTEAPYALRGESTEVKARKPAVELKSHGRAGTSIELNRQDQR